MRVTTAFNRLLALQGARVTDVLLGADGTVVRLDLAGQGCQLEYRLRRVRCSDCGVRVEAVPFARRGARHTRDFEDMVAFCAQQMAKTPICALLRIGWDTVGAIVARVVADRLDTERLAGLVMIGVDEISYRRRKRDVTQVCDHTIGAIVWARPGRNAQTLQGFFDEVGDRRSTIRAVSTAINGGYEKPFASRFPTPRSALTPSTYASSAAVPSTRCVAPSGTAGASPRPATAAGSRACAGR